ncbi:MAG: NAD(P)-dependent oxidoreductase [Chloroflexi bacterium]|nr:NAD(P)-dependent oxidoreductase [Chloroflexota bacterium]
MAASRRILVTGMSGLIGGLAGRHLARSHEVVALNRRLVEGVTTFQADINDLAAIRPAFVGVDTVVQLAAYMGDDQYGQLSTNVAGVYNVFEASREAGVKRVIFGSSGAAVLGHARDPEFQPLLEARWQDVTEPRPMLDHLVSLRPNSVYGAVKAFGEALGRYYSDFHGISVLCIRIGPVTEEDWPSDSRNAASYCSHRDVVQMVERCVNAPDSIRFDIFYAVSNNRGRFRDIAHARDVIGYEPLDGIPNWPMNRPHRPG